MKVKGLWYPEVQGRTTSKFVVNKYVLLALLLRRFYSVKFRYHHLASLATMFGPSPDWCVGISSVNLCLPDCSWIAERTFDLLPFDAGTDSGPTYMVLNRFFSDWFQAADLQVYNLEVSLYTCRNLFESAGGSESLVHVAKVDSIRR